ncbi:hypothetical protein DTO271G3_1435 [Paecilomyces variotii]|nr:hypothetical protein DTO271G3_1435 [Paecilomyces variotii]
MAWELFAVKGGQSLSQNFAQYLPSSLEYLLEPQGLSASLPTLVKSTVKSSLLLLGAAVSFVGIGSIPQDWGHHDQGFLEIQAHRGGTGMRTENSLWAFAYAMEVGIDVLEMDVVFTKDGIPVVWHDHEITAEKCRGDHVGAFVANLTLEEIKTMSCDLQLSEHPQAQVYEDTRIPTLEEVLDLIECYENKNVAINIETKLDPLKPNETFPVEKYVDDIVPLLERRGFASRTTLQSFDWRTLIGIKQKFPHMVIVALVEPEGIIPVDGGYPWLGGIDLADFHGDWIAAAASIGAEIVGPAHGDPWTVGVNTPGYVPWINAEVVKRAHEFNMRIFPWTVDDEDTIEKMLEHGVDGIITNYPERVMSVSRQKKRNFRVSNLTHRPHCLVNA